METRILDFVSYFRSDGVGHLFLLSLSLTCFVSNPTVHDCLCFVGKVYFLLQLEDFSLDLCGVLADFEEVLCDFDDVPHLSDRVDAFLDSLFVVLSGRSEEVGVLLSNLVDPRIVPWSPELNDKVEQQRRADEDDRLVIEDVELF